MTYYQPASFFKDLPAPTSLFSPACTKERFSNCPLFNSLHTLSPSSQHQSEAHPLSPQSHPHSCAKTPGCHSQTSSDFSSSTFSLSLTSLESALPDELRVLAEIGRSCPSLTPAESAPTKRRPGNVFRIRTYRKKGRTGGIMLTRSLLSRGRARLQSCRRCAMSWL